LGVLMRFFPHLSALSHARDREALNILALDTSDGTHRLAENPTPAVQRPRPRN